MALKAAPDAPTGLIPRVIVFGLPRPQRCPSRALQILDVARGTPEALASPTSRVRNLEAFVTVAEVGSNLANVVFDVEVVSALQGCRTFPSSSCDGRAGRQPSSLPRRSEYGGGRDRRCSRKSGCPRRVEDRVDRRSLRLTVVKDRCCNHTPVTSPLRRRWHVCSRNGHCRSTRHGRPRRIPSIGVLQADWRHRSTLGCSGLWGTRRRPAWRPRGVRGDAA